PHRVPGEVRQLQCCPRSFQRMPGEGRAWFLQHLDNVAVEGLYSDATRGVGGLQSRCGKRTQRRALILDPDSELSVIDDSRNLFDVPDCTTETPVRADRRQFLPTVEATVGPQCRLEKVARHGHHASTACRVRVSVR